MLTFEFDEKREEWCDGTTSWSFLFCNILSYLLKWRQIVQNSMLPSLVKLYKSALFVPCVFSSLGQTFDYLGLRKKKGG